MNAAPNLTARAKRDVQAILRDIDARSKRGAVAWYRKLTQVLQSIGDSPASFGFAPENADHDEEIRQAVFKTRKGLPYRAIFIVRDESIYVVHVRGSGQDQLDADELQVP
jgi:plasmid stabilization system protein ParE